MFEITRPGFPTLNVATPRVEDSIEKTKEAMLDGDAIRIIKEIVNWSNSQTPKLKHFREMRSKLKQVGNDKRDEDERSLETK